MDKKEYILSSLKLNVCLDNGWKRAFERKHLLVSMMYIALRTFLTQLNQNEVAKLQTVVNTDTSAKDEKKKPNVLLGKKKSQVELLAGCIKTKRKR